MQRASVFNDNADARCVILGLYRHFFRTISIIEIVFKSNFFTLEKSVTL